MRQFPRITGVVHLRPLPGTAQGGNAASMPGIVETALRDAHAWADGGADALIVENFGDVPFRKDHVLPQTVAAMSVVVAAIAAEIHLPLGVNVRLVNRWQ